jgi:hypothetical protein
VVSKLGEGFASLHFSPAQTQRVPTISYYVIYFQKTFPQASSNARYLFITPITTLITSIVMCHCAKGSSEAKH